MKVIPEGDLCVLIDHPSDFYFKILSQISNRLSVYANIPFLYLLWDRKIRHQEHRILF